MRATLVLCAMTLRSALSGLSGLVLGSALALLPGHATAEPPTANPTTNQQLESITVVARRDLDQMPVANLLAAEKAFMAGRAHAPAASLRFVVVPRDGALPIRSVVLHLDDPGAPVPIEPLEIALEQDGSFSLPQWPAPFTAKAVVRSNLSANSLHWRPQVLSPGVPEAMRRLGDLRLECEAKEAGHLNGTDLPFFARFFDSNPVSECASDDEHFFLAPAALSKVTLEEGGRQQDIHPDRTAEASTGRLLPRSYYIFEPGLRERAYAPPLGDPSWSDDSLVHFYFFDASQHPSH